jgi:hypothetical protein
MLITGHAIALSAVIGAAVALRHVKPTTSDVDVAVELTRITWAAGANENSSYGDEPLAARRSTAVTHR